MRSYPRPDGPVNHENLPLRTPSSAPFGPAVVASIEALVTVFVDDAHLPWRGRRWSHMVANSAEELHLAAEALGLRREYARDRGRTLHYDLPAEWRQRAIEQGLAEPISWRALVARRATIAAGRRGRPAPAPPG